MKIKKFLICIVSVCVLQTSSYAHEPNWLTNEKHASLGEQFKSLPESLQVRLNQISTCSQLHSCKGQKNFAFSEKFKIIEECMSSYPEHKDTIGIVTGYYKDNNEDIYISCCVLSLFLHRCKSSINNFFQKEQYVSKKLLYIPQGANFAKKIQDHFNIRNWTIRSKDTPIWENVISLDLSDDLFV